MRGHEDILRMRHQREVPAMIHIETDEGFDRFGSGARWPFGPDDPVVHISPTDALHRLDLRFVVNLSVQVSGMDAQRVKTAVDACIKAYASRVIGITHRQAGEGKYVQFPIVEVTDTAGAMTWNL